MKALKPNRHCGMRVPGLVLIGLGMVTGPALG